MESAGVIAMLDDIIARLQALGYEVTDADRAALPFVIDKVRYKVRNECNIDEIPEGLYAITVDVACGEFLSVKKAQGQLTGFDTSFAVKSIKEGDTQITYAVKDGAEGLDTLISMLMSGRSEFVTYRRFKW